MKTNMRHAMLLLLVFVVGCVAGYCIGGSHLPLIGLDAARTIDQIVADTKAHPDGNGRGDIRIVTDPSVAMIVPFGKNGHCSDIEGCPVEPRCSVDYGGTMRKISDLPKEFNRHASEIGMESLEVTNVLVEYRAPAKETGRLYANTPTCSDSEQIAVMSSIFEQAQAPAAK